MPKLMVLFAANGDSVASSPGTLWDLLANASAVSGGLDAETMTVGEVDNGQMVRALPLGAAIRANFSADERKRLVASLQERAAGYTRLAKWVKAIPEPESP